MKFISHIVLLFVGFSLGIWWGMYHPADAARLKDEEKQLIDKGKQVVQQEMQKHPMATNTPAPTTPSGGH